MNFRYKEVFIYLGSISLLIFFFYFFVNNLKNKPIEIINFIDSEIHEDFEIEITNNIADINFFLNEYLFIDNYLLKRKDNEISIQVNLKRPFAINRKTEEVIFYDNTKAPVSYFKSSYLDRIKLIDISKNSIYINKYLNVYYSKLSSLFDVSKIDYIEDRRYNLVLSNDKIVMLPKVIDKKLIYFIENNIDLIDKNTNYQKYLDLRNFHNKTIRLK